MAGLPYLQRAVELDPNFALAYGHLATSYSTLGQATRASENGRKAFDLRERVSERERYRIDAFYYSVVTGELEKPIKCTSSGSKAIRRTTSLRRTWETTT